MINNSKKKRQVNVNKQKSNLKIIPLRQQHVKVRQKSQTDVLKRTLVIGCAILVFLGGCGWFYHYETEPTPQRVAIHTTKTVNKIPKNLLMKPKNKSINFKASTFPKGVQGCYIKSIPMPQSSLHKYYQAVSIVRITRTEIFQQFLMTSRKKTRTPTKLSTNSMKRQKQFAKVQKQVNQNVPTSVQIQAQQIGLPSKLSNYNLDATVGNLKQRGNHLSYIAKMQTMISGYTTQKLAHLMGTKSLIALAPLTYQPINIYAYPRNLDIAINGQHFYKRSNKAIKQLMNQNNVAPYFVGFGEEKDNVKTIQKPMTKRTIK